IVLVQSLEQVVQVLAGAGRRLLQEQRVDTNPQGSPTVGTNAIEPSERSADAAAPALLSLRAPGACTRSGRGGGGGARRDACSIPRPAASAPPHNSLYPRRGAGDSNPTGLLFLR